MRLAPQYWETGQMITLHELLEHHHPKDGRPDLREWEWYYISSLLHRDILTLENQGGAIAWSPDSRYLSTSDNQRIKIWDVIKGKEIQTLSGHTDCVLSLGWSRDGRYLVSGSCDKTIKVWDIPTGQLLMTLVGHSSGVRTVTFSPDDTLLASGSETVKVWDTVLGTELHTFDGDIQGVSSLACFHGARIITIFGRLRGARKVRDWPQADIAVPSKFGRHLQEGRLSAYNMLQVLKLFPGVQTAGILPQGLGAKRYESGMPIQAKKLRAFEGILVGLDRLHGVPMEGFWHLVAMTVG
jgi:hypothetical protein